jgi:hypothetical protein
MATQSVNEMYTLPAILSAYHGTVKPHQGVLQRTKVRWSELPPEAATVSRVRLTDA